MTRYPFVVARRRKVVVEANSLTNALDRVLYKNPNKFITTTYARNVAKHLKNMDLINAQKQAKAKSKEKKGELIYVILEGDEFIVKDFMERKEKDDVYSIWRDGSKYEDTKNEIFPKDEEDKEVKQMKNENKTKAKMETKTKLPVKKAAKKIPAKKVAKKAAKKLTPKTVHEFEKGKLISISVKDMRANMKKGFYYRDPQGLRLSENWLKAANQDRIRKVIYEYKEKA